MEILTYGEDGLTLWALQNKLEDILTELAKPIMKGETIIKPGETPATPEECKVFYRPSFGRGEHGVGEFDFIIATPKIIYLGETKFFISNNYKSSEIRKKTQPYLRDEQINRPDNFRKIAPPEGSLLKDNVKNFQTLCGVECFDEKNCKNVILIIHSKDFVTDKYWHEEEATYKDTNSDEAKFTCIYIKAPLLNNDKTGNYLQINI